MIIKNKDMSDGIESIRNEHKDKFKYLYFLNSEMSGVISLQDLKKEYKDWDLSFNKFISIIKISNKLNITQIPQIILDMREEEFCSGDDFFEPSPEKKISDYSFIQFEKNNKIDSISKIKNNKKQLFFNLEIEKMLENFLLENNARPIYANEFIEILVNINELIDDNPEKEVIDFLIAIFDKYS